VATPAAAQSPLPQTASFKGPKPSRMTTDRKKAGVGRKKDRHAPREHLRRNDMATARQAVLRLSDMRGHWKPARPSSEQGGGCRGNDPDFSRFTITGKAHSAFGGGDSFIESRVKLFANAGQAEQYFAAAYNRTFLRCIRDGVKRWLAEGGLRPRVVDARFSTGAAGGRADGGLRRRLRHHNSPRDSIRLSHRRHYLPDGTCGGTPLVRIDPFRRRLPAMRLRALRGSSG